jgi:hypothetical protein
MTRLGWTLLIIVGVMAIPIPGFLVLAICIMIVFRIPRCIWDRAAKKKA